MIDVVGVRFDNNVRIYYFDPCGLKLRKQDRVIVESMHGLEVVTVVKENQQVADVDIVLPIKPIIRKVTKQDQEQLKMNYKLEKDAYYYFLKELAKVPLEMRLVSVKYSFDRKYVIFCYTADDRVDFREFVKKLALKLRTRIEMRQISMREKARYFGGVGPCGYDLCCSTFLSDLRGSTIKMVKNQKLSLIPERISGLCGKLLCCIRYENETYLELSEYLPDTNKRITTIDGEGKVIYVNVLTQQIDVLFIDEKGNKIRKKYDYNEYRDALISPNQNKGKEQ